MVRAAEYLRSLALAGLVVATCLQVATAARPAASEADGSAPFAQSDRAATLARIDAWLKQEAGQGRFSGAVLIAHRGQPVYEGAFGLADREAGIPNTIETPFNICSMGKMLTATTAMLLVEEGRLDLRTPIAKYLPDFPRPDRGRRSDSTESGSPTVMATSSRSRVTRCAAPKSRR